jgi:hypothetical protein
MGCHRFSVSTDEAFWHEPDRFAAPSRHSGCGGIAHITAPTDTDQFRRFVEK